MKRLNKCYISKHLFNLFLSYQNKVMHKNAKILDFLIVNYRKNGRINAKQFA